MPDYWKPSHLQKFIILSELAMLEKLAVQKGINWNQFTVQIVHWASQQQMQFAALTSVRCPKHPSALFLCLSRMRRAFRGNFWAGAPVPKGTPLVSEALQNQHNMPVPSVVCVLSSDKVPYAPSPVSVEDSRLLLCQICGRNFSSRLPWAKCNCLFTGYIAIVNLFHLGFWFAFRSPICSRIPR